MQVASLALLLMSVCDEAFSQDRRSSSREDELRSIPDRIAGEPDSIKRLVSMEGIIREGDALKTQLAIKSALGVDDPELRGLALRAFLASQRNIIVDVGKEGETAKTTPPTLRFQVKSFDIGSGRGSLQGGGYTFDLDITGDSLRFDVGRLLDSNADCEVALSPARNFRLTGTARCRNRSSYDLSIRMY